MYFSHILKDKTFLGREFMGASIIMLGIGDLTSFKSFSAQPTNFSQDFFNKFDQISNSVEHLQWSFFYVNIQCDKVVEFFSQKSSIVDVWRDSKCDSSH